MDSTKTIIILRGHVWCILIFLMKYQNGLGSGEYSTRELSQIRWPNSRVAKRICMFDSILWDLSGNPRAISIDKPQILCSDAWVNEISFWASTIFFQNFVKFVDQIRFVALADFAVVITQIVQYFMLMLQNFRLLNLVNLLTS